MSVQLDHYDVQLKLQTEIRRLVDRIVLHMKIKKFIIYYHTPKWIVRFESDEFFKPGWAKNNNKQSNRTGNQEGPTLKIMKIKNIAHLILAQLKTAFIVIIPLVCNI